MTTIVRYSWRWEIFKKNWWRHRKRKSRLNHSCQYRGREKLWSNCRRSTWRRNIMTLDWWLLGRTGEPKWRSAGARQSRIPLGSHLYQILPALWDPSLIPTIRHTTSPQLYMKPLKCRLTDLCWHNQWKLKQSSSLHSTNSGRRKICRRIRLRLR